MASAPQSRNQVDRLPKIVINASHAGQICCVCLAAYCEGENVTELPQCHHIHHTACIRTWLERDHRCPICRTDVFQAPMNAARQPQPQPQLQIQSRRRSAYIAPPQHIVIGHVYANDTSQPIPFANQPENHTQMQPTISEWRMQSQGGQRRTTPAWAPQEMPLPNQAQMPQPSNVEWGMRRQNRQRRTNTPPAWAHDLQSPNRTQGQQPSNATGGSRRQRGQRRAY